MANTLHFGLMANHSNGGFASAITLVHALQKNHQLRVWSLFGTPYSGHEEQIGETGARLERARPAMQIAAGDHVFFYMNEYPSLIANYRDAWQTEMAKAGSIQIALNRTLGTLPIEEWLAPKLAQLFFQSADMQSTWLSLTNGNALGNAPSIVMPPPVDLRPFLTLQKCRQQNLVIGRLAGDTMVPEDAIECYSRLAMLLPDAQFWFMPAPPELQRHFSDHRQFRFLAANEITVAEFLTNCDIFLLLYTEGLPVPGPRSLVEAMAAGCAPVSIHRDGPKDRIEHGVSGFCSNDTDEVVDFVVTLAKDSVLREKIGHQARLRAQAQGISHWVAKIMQVTESKNHV